MGKAERDVNRVPTLIGVSTSDGVSPIPAEIDPATGELLVKTTVASLPLPTGAATSAKQDALLTELQLKADLTETQPVSTASLPLPSGAATSANQTTIINALAAINSFTPSTYDSITLSYTGSNLTGVVFKLGVTTISTLTLAYTGSDLISVTKT